LTVIVPSIDKQELGSVTIPKVITGASCGAAVIDAAKLVQPATVCVTVYSPAVLTEILALVSDVDQRKLEPLAVKTELPQPSFTLTDGADGTANGAAVTEAGVLVHPPTVCVTVYGPAEVTVMDPVVAPVDQSRFDPVAVNTDEPQLSTAETAGTEGNESGAAVPEPAELVHPLIVCVTVYVPGVVTVIDAVV
jgi:hypothetical protein